MVYTVVALTTGQHAMITTWSISKLSDFDQCKLRAKLKYLDKVPEPDRPLKAGQTETAIDRGTRVHKAAELFISSDIELVEELKKFEEDFFNLRSLYRQNKVFVEQEWAVDKDWIAVAWNSETVWLRSKVDAFVKLSEEEAIVIDFKTGKSINPVQYSQQTQLYQLLAFLRYPNLKKVTTELWYLDIGEKKSMLFTKEQGLSFFKYFNEKGQQITTCSDFPPNPNIYSCRWCPYSPKGTGHCTVGV